MHGFYEVVNAFNWNIYMQTKIGNTTTEDKKIALRWQNIS